MTDEHFMRKALDQARQALEMGEVPIGAVIVSKDQIIARGYNQVELLKDCTAHAEMLALSAAFAGMGTKYLPEATLYVTLEPCLMCCGALYWSKISRIVYGATDDRNGFHRYFSECPEAAGKVLHPKTRVTQGILQEECLSLLQDFFQEKRH